MDDLEEPPGNRGWVGMAPDIAPKGHARYARVERIAHLAEQAAVISGTVAAQDDHGHSRAFDHAAHALRITRIEGLDIVGAHLGGLPTDTGDVLRRVLVGLVETAGNDLGL